MKVCICISTFKRKDYLKYLLAEINKQEGIDHITLHVVVVDNDAARSSEIVVQEALNGYKYDLRYQVEEKRGIPYSRNKAVSMAPKDCDFIVFVDDDEYPEKQWIAKLLEVHQNTEADVVSGPVYAKFSDNTPKWIINGKYLSRHNNNTFKTAELLPHTVVATNNVLIRYSLIEKMSGPSGPFDEALALTGGEDSDLARRMYNNGAKIVWSAEAVVWEWVPKNRASFAWILQRAFRTANTTWVLSDKKTFSNRIKIIILSIVRLLVGLVLAIPALLLSVVLGFQFFVKFVRIFVRGIGMLLGAMGYQYEEYKHFYTS